MDRRSFLKIAGLGGTAMYVPASLTIDSLLNKAYATSPNYSGMNVNTAPLAGRMPQVIHVFLYGGPSELSGNLSQIADIAANSQSSYENNITGITDVTTNPGGQITNKGFWNDAGGATMEFLVDNNYMSVYRTMMKRVNDTRSHRESIFQSQKGTTNVEARPGIGTVLAHILDRNRAAFQTVAGKPVDQLILPFISFEGETTYFTPDPNKNLELRLRYQTLGSNLQNPFSRDESNNTNNILDNLVNSVTSGGSRYSKIKDAFAARTVLETNVGNLQTAFDAPLTFAGPIDVVDQAQDFTGNTLSYPSNTFASQIRAAVTLAIENQDTLFISVGNVGLGGWDDHNNGCDRYAGRMQDLFDALRAACKHIKYASGTTPGGANRLTDNIMINVHGEFGRRVNLNGSCGWDHGNMQNLFTLMGSGIRPAGALGKVVGRTQRTGTSNTNNQFQVPAAGSYEFEPASLASTIYQAFGVTNPEVLTADEVMNPAGSPAINQTVAGEPPIF